MILEIAVPGRSSGIDAPAASGGVSPPSCLLAVAKYRAALSRRPPAGGRSHRLRYGGGPVLLAAVARRAAGLVYELAADTGGISGRQQDRMAHPDVAGYIAAAE